MSLYWSYKDPRDQNGQDEAFIPLIPNMATDSDDKLPLAAQKGVAVRGESDDGSSNEVAKHKKPPWWSYIWVRLI